MSPSFAKKDEGMQPLKIAVVGAGFIGAQHIDAILRQPGARLVAVADPNEANLGRLGAHLPAAHLYADYTDMLAHESIDVVHNCTPNALHAPVAFAAMERGAHVYGEKPLCATRAQGLAMVKMAKDKGLAGAVNFVYRGNAMVWEMRERLRTGDAGRCFLMHGAYLQDWLMHAEDYDWRIEEAGDGPRALADIGSHWLDLAQFVSGQKITRINASLFIAHATRTKGRPDGSFVDSPVRSEDGGLLQMGFEDGTIGSAVLSQVSGGYKNSIALSVDCENYSMQWQQQAADRLTIGSRKGGEQTLFADPRLLTGAAKAMATLPAGHASAWADALRNSVGQFYAAIRTGAHLRGETTGYATFEDALQIMDIIDAALASAKDGRWHDVA